MNKFLPLLILLAFILSCSSPEKLLDKRKYDLVIQRAEKVFERKKNKPYPWVSATEASFVLANARDWDFIKKQEAIGGLSAWKNIYYTALKIERRQNKIATLLPLQAENGYIASFQFSDTRSKIEDARNWIGEKYYSLANQTMEDVRAGSKKAALTSIRLIDSALVWTPSIDQVLELRQEATDSALVKVGVYFHREGRLDYVSDAVEEALYRRFNNFFRQHLQVDIEPTNAVDIDYYFFVKPQDIYIGPDIENVRETNFSKEIVTGQKTVKEWSKKDSCWVVTTIDIVETVHATLIAYEQIKEADMTVDVSIEDTEYYHTYATKKLYASEDFNNEYSRVIGDSRAIDCIVFSGFCWSYPSDGEMEHALSSSIAGSLKQYIKKYNWWFD